MKTKATYFVVFLILFPLLVVTCSKYISVSYGDNGITAEVKNITIGTLKEVASSSIGISGGTITVSESGTKIDGLTITVPESSFTSAQTITVSVADITGHQLGDNFKPISPLINVVCDGGYANELMSITIPITVPAGSIALGFILDAETGKLEGIPVAEATNNSITLLTRHFLSGNMLRAETPTLKGGKGFLSKGANIIITSLAESMLMGLTSITSGYKPGTDDWEFVNRGSFIAPGGHCAGQTFTSMWYYYEMKAAEGDLFEKFSRLAGYDKDNARGYRFSSVVQEDLDFGGTLNDFLWANVDLNPETDKLKMYTIAGAMLVTGEPQAIGIYRIKDHTADGKPIYGGHALVCYAASISGGKLSIADPNKPGLVQEINYVNDKFQPYIAMANAEAASDPYPFITYSAKTAFIEWDQIGRRYAELLNFTIGTVGANKFPEYKIMVKGKVDKELTDDFSIVSDTLRTEVELPDAYMYFEADGKTLVRHVMVNEKGQTINTWDGVGSYTILKPGVNIIGFDIYAKKEGAVDIDGNLRDLFVDFKWFNVNYMPLEITPNPLKGVRLVDYTFTARTRGFAPANAKYVWNFGDGSAEVTKLNDSTVVHKFPEDADYEIMVTLYDNSTNQKICDAYSTAEIKSDILSELKEYKYVNIKFTGDLIMSQPEHTPYQISVYNDFVIETSSDYPVVWDGKKFSVEFSYDEWSWASMSELTQKGTINVEMSENGMEVLSIVAEMSTSDGSQHDKTTISAINIPWHDNSTYTGALPRFLLTGPEVQSHIRTLTYTNTFSVCVGCEIETVTLQGVNYNNQDKPPQLEFWFRGKRE